jgi:hypothetical protein
MCEHIFLMGHCSCMHTTGISFKATGSQMGYHYTVISRLVRKHTQTNNVKDLPRSAKPRGCSLGCRLYFCVSKPSSGRRLHEAEIGSRSTNGSCVMSLHSNHIEHIWDMLGRHMHAREPPVQAIRQLEAALHREWQQLSQQEIRRLTRGCLCTQVL